MKMNKVHMPLYLINILLLYALVIDLYSQTISPEVYKTLYSNEQWVQSDSTILKLIYTYNDDVLDMKKHKILYCVSIREDGNMVRYVTSQGRRGFIFIENIYNFEVEEIILDTNFKK